MEWDQGKEYKITILCYNDVENNVELIEGLVPKIELHTEDSQTVISTCYAETRKGRKLCSDALDDMLKTTSSYNGVYGIAASLYGENIKSIELNGRGKVRVEISPRFSDEQMSVFLGEFEKEESSNGVIPNNHKKLIINLENTVTGTQTLDKIVSQIYSKITDDNSVESNSIMNNANDRNLLQQAKTKYQASTPIIKPNQSFIVNENVFIRGDLGTFKIILCKTEGNCSEEVVSSEMSIGGAYYSPKSPGRFSMSIIHEIPSYMPSLPFFNLSVFIKERFDKPEIFEINKIPGETKIIAIKGNKQGSIKYVITKGFVPLEHFCTDKTFVHNNRCIMINKDFNLDTPIKISSPFTVASYVKAREEDEKNTDSNISILFSDLHQTQLLHFGEVSVQPNSVKRIEKFAKTIYVYEDELPKQLTNSLIIELVVFVVLLICAFVFIFIVPSWNSMIKVYLSTVKTLKTRKMKEKEEEEEIEPLKKKKSQNKKYENNKKYSQMLQTANDWINRYSASNTITGEQPSAPVTTKITKNALELPTTKFDIRAFRSINKSVDVTDEGEIIPVCHKCDYNSDILYTCAECSLKSHTDSDVEIHLLCPDCAHEHIVNEHDIKTCEFPSCNRVMFCSKCNKIKPHLYLDESKAFYCEQCATRKIKKCPNIKLCGECYLSAASIICLTCDMNLCPSCDWRTHITSKETNHSRLNANLRATSSNEKKVTQ